MKLLPKTFMPTDDMETLRLLHSLCDHTGKPPYHFEGRTLRWGEDVPRELMTAMRDESEVLVLLDESEKPYAFIMCDGYGEIRERRVLMY